MWETNILPGKFSNDRKDISDRAAERITGLINIRESVGRLIDLQLEDAPDEEIIAARDRLNKTYDSFVKDAAI